MAVKILSLETGKSITLLGKNDKALARHLPQLVLRNCEKKIKNPFSGSAL